MVATLRGMGRDIGTSCVAHQLGLPDLAGTLARSVLEELPQSLRLLRTTSAG
jgi:carbamoyltransferase